MVEVTSASVADWLASGDASFAVCDASVDADLSCVATAWIGHREIARREVGRREVVLAGTAATIAAAAFALDPGRDRPARPALSAPALVVCGSLHPVAEAQVDELVAAGALLVSWSEGAAPAVAALRAGQHAVLTTGSFERDATSVVSSSLGEVAREVIASGAARTVVVMGGDTTAAVLGRSGDASRWHAGARCGLVREA